MPDFLAACRGEPVDRVPVWFMRQAGRSLPEYRAIRGSGSILDAIGDPSLACEITLQPVRRYGVDAAILFSDIVVPYHAIGFGVDVVAGRGPVIARPFTDASDLDRLRDIEPADIEHVDAADRIRRSTVHGRELPRRRGADARVRRHQDHDARRPVAVRPAPRSSRLDHHLFLASASGPRSQCGAALRLVGRRPDESRV